MTTPGIGAPGTSWINPNSRGGIFYVMVSANGNVTPENFGCVYCHNNPSNTRMKGVLDHFLGGWASKHPVGYNWNTGPLAGDTSNEYVSTVGSATANELDCVNCHDATLLDVGGYVNHAAPPAGNPNYLKNVTTAENYDNLCRNCHQNTPVDVAGKGHVITLTSHSQGTIVETDLTPFKSTVAGGTNQCTKCHDTHFSGRVKFFNDGHEGDTPIVGTDCISVCHYPGDNVGYVDDTSASGNNYERHGHGRALSTYEYKAGVVDFANGAKKTMNMACTSCHLSLDTGTTDASRKPHAEKNPTGATNGIKYAKRYNIGLSMQDEGNGSSFGNPILGVCENCHSSYQSHNAHTGGTVVSGCQDCHDEHAEGSGAASGGNVFMIPQTSRKTGTFAAAPPRTRTGTESVVYTTERIDPATGTERTAGLTFFNAAATGACDNSECHPAGTGYTPLSTFLGNSTHSGGNQSAGSDCEGCHQHTGDPSSSWRASDSCSSCHGYPPTGSTGHEGTVSVNHDLRSDGGAFLMANHYGCGACHGVSKNLATNGFLAQDPVPMRGIDTYDISGTGSHKNGNVTMNGDRLANGNTTDAGYNATNGGCDAIACHANDASHRLTRGNAVDLLEIGPGSCSECHGTDGARWYPDSGAQNGAVYPNRAGAHQEHVAAIVARNPGTLATDASTCNWCHPGGSHSGDQVTSPADIMDGSVNDFKSILGVNDVNGAFVSASSTCTNVDCHGATVTPGWYSAPAFTCTGCHASPPTSGGNAGSHAKHANSDTDYTDCNACHPGTSSYTNSHLNGAGQLAFDGSAVNAVYNPSTNQMSYTDNAVVIYNDTSGYALLYASEGDGIDNGTCAGTPANYCHGTGTPAWGGTVTCGSCHSGGGGTLAPVVTSASTHVDADGSGGAYTAGTCTNCHAGHRLGVQIPLPPTSWSNVNLAATNMRTQLGINYTNTGGIYLGGPGTVASINAKTTEAEICWGCHDTPSVGTISEWGYNTDTSPGNYPDTHFPTQDGDQSYNNNNGWLYNSAYGTKVSNWTQGYWMSPYTDYSASLRRRVASIHSVSLDPAGQSSSVATNVNGSGVVNRTTPTLESVGYIRCSYCHDVHQLNKAVGDVNKVPPEPYLRGTWVADPYPPELPPRSGTYSTNINTNAAGTPRARTTARDKGGYFIDQNSSWPTKNAAMDSLAETAGLCSLCHGTSVNTMDYYSNASTKLWLTGMTNGHANSTLGGTGTGKVDLFTGNRGTYGMGMQAVVGTGRGGYGTGQPLYRQYCNTGNHDSATCNNIVNSGWFLGTGADAGRVGTTTAFGGDYANWYGAGTIGRADLTEGANALAHKFTCSKCHNPHATGWPALLNQNCIDTSLSTFSYLNANATVNQANNCHRKTATTNGWHRLAPGQ